MILTNFNLGEKISSMHPIFGFTYKATSDQGEFEIDDFTIGEIKEREDIKELPLLVEVGLRNPLNRPPQIVVIYSISIKRDVPTPAKTTALK